jgi:hypothetical protein
LAYDFVEFTLIGYGLTQPVELLFGQGHGNRFASYFTGPYESAALLRGLALKDTALREETQPGQSPL